MIIIITLFIIYCLVFYREKYKVEIIDLEEKDDFYFIKQGNKYNAVNKFDPKINYKIEEWEWLRIKKIKELWKK